MALIRSPTHAPVRPTWLATTSEAAIEPGSPVIDAHHHLYDRPGSRYLLNDFLDDLCSGHNVRATVIVQARSMLRADAEPTYQSVGETEFANGVAAMSASGIYGEARVGAGIVGFADLMQGEDIVRVLEQHISRAGGTPSEGGRFCGIRQSLTWDIDASLLNPLYPTSQHMMESCAFRAGFSQLQKLGLSFEGWVFFHQLPMLAKLARDFPDTPIVLNHCGGIVGIEKYENYRDEVFEVWRRGILEIAKCRNVMVKLSGLGMRLGGFRFEDQERAPFSTQLATAWRPWIDVCLSAFGADRCMYGSNFPVDKGSYSYAIGLNALKRLTSGATPGEKSSIFAGSAATFYRLPASFVQGRGPEVGEG
ncbi:amidohydrolase family protein [Achromobacter spanius]|uniref:amidohydrolase family protein n=1 Tax=Achromobacter spanius TaxID=217203 RepID=UPI0036E6EDCF